MEQMKSDLSQTGILYIKLKVEHFPDISASVFCKELYLVCTLLFNNPWVHITEFLSVRIYNQRSLQALSFF